MLDAKALGNRIREFRTQKGLSQKMLAETLNVSFQAISNWERGIAPPDLENLINIASFFGITVDSLLYSNVEDLYLGIDGGGTKTEFVLISAEGHVRKRIIKHGCNPNDIGYTQMLALIVDGISDILAEYKSIKAIFCGIAGITSGNYAKELKNELKKRYPQINLQVKNDSLNLFALDDAASMALISGTGSVVFVKNGDSYERLGGWGYLFDTAGSAYDIGRDAVRVALREEERQEAPSLLTVKLRKKLNTTTIWEHISTLYKEGKPYIASLAPVVFDAYKQKDAQARRIIEDNAKALAELLNTGVKLHGVAPVAIASGGLFEHFEDIIIPFITKYTDVKIKVCTLPPVYGACRQSIRLIKDNLLDTFEENFKNSYGGK